MKSCISFLLVLTLALPTALKAQWDSYQSQEKIQPRLMLGGGMAMFRISLSDFEQVYTSRWGESYGGFVGVRAFGAHYITFKYGSFQKSGRSGVDPMTGKNLQNAKWDEQWYKLGLRIHPPVEQKWGSYYGFGIAAYDISEVQGVSVFDDTAHDNSGLGTGFYLEVGIDYFMYKKASLFFDMEIASGGMQGKTGFEAMSVGGWKFTGGVSFWPF